MNVTKVKKLKLDWPWIKENARNCIPWTVPEELNLLETSMDGIAYWQEKPFRSVYLLNGGDYWEVSASGRYVGHYWSFKDYLEAFSLFTKLLQKSKNVGG